MKSKLGYLIFAIVIVSAFGEQSTTNASLSESRDSLDDKNSTNAGQNSDSSGSTTAASNSDIKKLTRKRCAREYNMNCLKVDLIASVEKLAKNTDFHLLPGVRVVANSDSFTSQRSTDDSRMVFSAENVSDKLDELLVRRLLSYTRSLSVNVQIFDKDQQRKGKSFGFSFLPNLMKAVEGRDKKQGKWSGTLMAAAVLTGGALLWMGLSSLMAMAAKALAASLLSIIISLVTAYKSSGHGSHKSTTYEIVAKPVYSHAYTAELQHEPHTAATGHQYGRNMEWDKMASMSSSRSEVQVPIREDAQHLAYRTHVRPIFKRSAI